MSEFVEYVNELFHEFGEVSVRRMFGGHGVFRDGLMFALIADDMLYLKTDAENVSDYQARGLPPFEYNKKGKRVSLSYYLAPEEALEDAGELARWARRAFDAALRGDRKRNR